MGTIYRNLRAIPIPAKAQRNAQDNKVTAYYPYDDSYYMLGKGDSSQNRIRYVIGEAVSATTLIPNDNFRFCFPDEWYKYFGKDANIPQALIPEVYFGKYALALGAGYRTGI